eukprot:jgi/Antlo1/862/1973
MQFPFCRKVLKMKIVQMEKELEARMQRIQHVDDTAFLPKRSQKKSI